MLNSITIHGYLGRDPEITTVEGIKGPYKKATFSVGVSRDFGDETDWFYCVSYGNRAEIVDKWLRKGYQVTVLGRMESYKPKNDPQRTAWILKVLGFDFCDKKNADTAPGDNAPDGFEPITDEDIEF